MLAYVCMASEGLYQARMLQIKEIDRLQSQAFTYSCLTLTLLALAEDPFLISWPQCVISHSSPYYGSSGLYKGNVDITLGSHSKYFYTKMTANIYLGTSSIKVLKTTLDTVHM